MSEPKSKMEEEGKEGGREEEKERRGELKVPSFCPIGEQMGGQTSQFMRLLQSS
jgi:hypothetical protein